MKDNLDDLSDDELYASYEAYKALLEAGLTKDQALNRTGITAQIVKDFEAEEEDMDFKEDFKEVWDDEESDKFDDETNWKEDGDFDDSGDWGEDDLVDDADEGF